jgi:ribose-phosphate pyrophosphokinase
LPGRPVRRIQSSVNRYAQAPHEQPETETTHVGDIKANLLSSTISGGWQRARQIDALYQAGAEGKVCFSITHPVLLPSALHILDTDDRIEKLVVTNTLPIPPEKRHPKIEVVSVGRLLAEIIQDIHEGHSISAKLVKA